MKFMLMLARLLALQKGSCLHNFNLGLNLNTKMQLLGAQGIAQSSSPVASFSQPSLWQGKSFCFPWTLGQLGIRTPAKPSLPQHNEAELSIPRCVEGKCPVCPFLMLPFQVWSGRELKTAGGQPGSGLRSGQWIFPLETLDLTACGRGKWFECSASCSAGLKQLESAQCCREEMTDQER